MVSVITLYLLGRTLNVHDHGRDWPSPSALWWTDTTVEWKKLHRNASQGKGSLRQSWYGASRSRPRHWCQTLRSCIVFVPVVTAHWPGEVPLHTDGHRRGRRRLASYILSRTISDDRARYAGHELAQNEDGRGKGRGGSASPSIKPLLSRIHPWVRAPPGALL